MLFGAILVKMPGIEIVHNEDEMENNVPISDIADLLFQQFVVISGKIYSLSSELNSQ